MRLLTLIFASLLGGAVLGSTLAVVAYKTGQEIPYQLARLDGANSTAAMPGAPRVEVPETSYDFGRMQVGEIGSHEFIVKNTGSAPLTLKVASTTCKCTLGSATDKPIPPGASTVIKMDWHAEGNPGRFRQSATINTNDPLSSQLFLDITGIISEAVTYEPRQFYFDRISSGESKSARVVVYSIDNDMQIKGIDVIPDADAKYFDISTEPIQAETLAVNEARSGFDVIVAAKPGLPVGTLGQHVRIHTNLPNNATIEIPIVGRVVGEISVFGNEFDGERGILRLGNVKSAEGKVAKLNLVIRGDGAADVKLKLESLDPPELQVTIGETSAVNDTLARVPIEIAVPPGTPPMVRLGTAQGREGHVIFSTTHPKVPQLSIVVRFSVER